MRNLQGRLKVDLFALLLEFVGGRIPGLVGALRVGGP